ETISRIPPSLQETRRQLALFSRDQRIIPTMHRVHVLVPLDDKAYYSNSEPRRYGEVVSVNKIQNIVSNTSRCIKQQAAEAVWNTEVHHQTLRHALRKDGDRMGDDLVDFSSCTSAGIHRQLLDKRVQAKMVDFCICIHPDAEADTGINTAIKQLRDASPSESVNHTDYSVFRNYPIALSIESKIQDGSEGAATLQIGTWHAAHWKYLSQHAHKEALNRLEFLPGLIVQGARWYFLGSTSSDGDTTVWSTQLIGETNSEIGAFRVIRAIQYLAWWCAEVYWPWFRANVLNL
ncbi:hypothetical protein BDP55DRAFT_527007, partial [Colletotrichum godetiae]